MHASCLRSRRPLALDLTFQVNSYNGRRGPLHLSLKKLQSDDNRNALNGVKGQPPEGWMRVVGRKSPFGLLMTSPWQLGIL